MDVVKKICRFGACAKEFYTKKKPRRYCSSLCAFHSTRHYRYIKYLEGKTREAKQPTFSFMYALEWLIENDLSWLHVGKERYYE